MSFLAPWLLAAGALGAAAVVALHLLSTRRPPRVLLPTARFVPASEARAVARSSRPTDLVLLALRVLAVLLIGAAFARPVLDAPGPRVRSVVLLDASASVADRASAAREAVQRLTEGGALVPFDTGARVASPAEVQAARSLAGARERATDVVGEDGVFRAGPPRPAKGILSAALVAGVRAARAVARGADSVRLVIVSPLAEELFDAATRDARASWPGGVELVRVAAASDTMSGPRPRLDSPLADDPFAPAIARLSTELGGQEVRVVRRALVAADSAWVRAAGRVLVHWPVGERAEAHPDGVIAFGLHAATLVAPLARLPIALDTAAPRATAVANRAEAVPTRVVARWRDGSVAAAERRVGAGCIRDVTVGIPLAGDITLRPPFEAFLTAMVEPCGGARGVAVSDSVAAAVAGGSAAVSARLLTAAGSTDARLAAWLLGGALLALMAEWVLRRRRTA